MSIVDFVGITSASPTDGSCAKGPARTGPSSTMTATSCVSNPERPCSHARHQSGCGVKVPVLPIVKGGPELKTTVTASPGMKQCAAVKNTVGDSAEPEHSDTNPGMVGTGWMARPTY